ALPAVARNPVPPPPQFSDGPSPFIKTRLCKKFKTAEGCKFGDNCNFAHGEWELGKPAVPHHEDPRSMGQMQMQMQGRFGGARSFGASSTAKISIDASVAGAVIGKGGVNSKQICRVTGAKLSVRDHESDPNLRNIEMEGTFDQIKQASQMVQELIANIRAAAASGPHGKSSGMQGHGGGGGGNNFKTKLCEKFSRGSCTFGERCHFAHGEGELRKSGL
ncbi:zinc finger CCCH domain-containing protein 14, partial [Phtheirospermum japonicum]